MRCSGKLLLPALAAVVLVAVVVSTTVGSAAKPAAKDGVFIHVTKGVEDPHSVLMAFQMAQIMAKDKDVLVYLDIQAISVVLKDAPDLKMHPFDSSKTALRRLLEGGVTIMACPGCLKAARKTPADLMDGIKVADKEAFFGFTQGRILTLDY